MSAHADLRAQFDAEVKTAGLDLPPLEHERLFAMWAEHRSQREALRAAVPAPVEEPNA